MWPAAQYDLITSKHSSQLCGSIRDLYDERGDFITRSSYRERLLLTLCILHWFLTRLMARYVVVDIGQINWLSCPVIIAI